MRYARHLRSVALAGVLLGPFTASAAAGPAPAPAGGSAEGSVGGSVGVGGSATNTGASADGSAAAGTDGNGRANLDAERQAQREADRQARQEAIAAEVTRSPFRRHGPRARSWELGLFGGIATPSRGLNLRDEAVPFKRYARVAGDFGVRAGYYFMPLFGLEGEFGLITGRVAATDDSVLLYSARLQPILQIPFWRLAPFASLGIGMLGVSSDATAMGNDIDFIFSYGAGLKFFINRNVGLRLDVRTNLSEKFIDPDAADSEEYLLGLVVRLGPKPTAPPPPPDRDADGFVDAEDLCPDEAGVAPDGCPVRDSDADGFLDPEDACPAEAGVAPDGCPIRDSDGDGFLDDVDECPEEPGIEPDGCPVRDTDGDGIYDDVDKCIDEPENHNGYQDKDGCIDKLPEDIKIFVGVIAGIYFQSGKAQIRKRSERTLTKAAKVLRDHPELKVEISGHTDSRGSRDLNMKLSADRAAEVKAWLVGHGVEGERLTTRGAGPDEPVAENSTKKGRAANRRIEFKLVP